MDKVDITEADPTKQTDQQQQHPDQQRQLEQSDKPTNKDVKQANKAMLFVALPTLSLKPEHASYQRSSDDDMDIDEVRVSACAQECTFEVREYIEGFGLVDPTSKYPELRMWWAAV